MNFFLSLFLSLSFSLDRIEMMRKNEAELGPMISMVIIREYLGKEIGTMTTEAKEGDTIPSKGKIFKTCFFSLPLALFDK